MSDFDDFVKKTTEEHLATRRRKADEYQEKENRKNQMASLCQQAIIGAFASDGRFGDRFKPNELQQVLHPAFEFTMVSRDFVLHFTGKVVSGSNSPTDLGVDVTLRVGRQQQNVPTGSEYPVKIDIRSNGACIPVALYETVTAAVGAFITR